MPKTLENRLDDLMHEIQEIKKSIVLDKFAKVEGGQKKNKCMEHPRKESFVKMGWPLSSRGNHSAEGKDLVKRHWFFVWRQNGLTKLLE